MEEGTCLINDLNETNHSWIVEVNNKLSNMGSIPETQPLIKKKSSIYRRPINVREEQNTFCYTPFIISFGPYHHDHISCQQTNDIKESVLLRSLKRSSKTVDNYSKALSEMVQDLKDAYDELDPRWRQDDDAFLRLMIYDGCFFLEILRDAESFDEQKHLGHLSREVLDIYRISLHELMEYYRHDMLLLENQLPLQLLVKLVAIQDNLSIQEAKKDLYKRILGFVLPSSPNIAEKLLTQDEEHTLLHALDLYRHRLLYQEHKGESTLQISEQITLDSDDESDLPCALYCVMFGFAFIIALPICAVVMPIGLVIGIILVLTLLLLQALKCLYSGEPSEDIYFIIPSATELDKVGIGFHMSKTKSLKDISFGSGTLKLPEIYVDGATQSGFLNIIAFEQLHRDALNEVTSYIFFMSRLLKVGGDVRLLQLCSIIHTPLHNDQVAELFKSLAKDIQHDPKIFLVETHRNVGKRLTGSFYSKMNNPWQRDLWQTYLKSPWAVISILAAFFLFSLTSIQTAYSILSYYNQK